MFICLFTRHKKSSKLYMSSTVRMDFLQQSDELQRFQRFQRFQHFVSETKSKIGPQSLVMYRQGVAILSDILSWTSVQPHSHCAIVCG